MSATPLRIGLYLKTFLGWQGGREYARNLLMNLRAYESARGPGAFEVCLLATRSIPEESVEEFQPLAHSVHRLTTDLKRKPHAFFDGLQRLGINFAFPVHNTALGEVRSADCIFDFQHRHLTHFFSAAESRDRDRSFERILRYADKVIVSSDTSRHDLNTFFPGHDDMVRVLPFGTFPKEEWIAGDPRTVLARYHLPPRFFHVSNQFWAHKNHAAVFQALKKLVEGGSDAQVVCTGSLTDYRGSSGVDTLLSYLHQNGLYPHVHLMGLMPRRDQLQVMRAAVAVVQPSLFEGWSTVLEDARTFGKRTLASALPVHREQNLPGAAYFAPTDPEELARLMAEIWNSSSSGYDAQREAAAFAAARERSLVFAQKFLTIAAEPAPAQRSRRLERRAASAWEKIRSPFRRSG